MEWPVVFEWTIRRWLGRGERPMRKACVSRETQTKAEMFHVKRWRLTDYDASELRLLSFEGRSVTPQVFGSLVPAILAGALEAFL
jgi:hypothetical protein